MIMLTISLLWVACVLAKPVSYSRVVPYASKQSLLERNSHVEILKQINQINVDGSYTFGFEASDGTFRAEHKDANGYVTGKFGYIDADGQLQISEYVAGTNKAGRSLGYQTMEAIPSTTLNPIVRVNPTTTFLGEQPKFFQYGQSIFRSPSVIDIQTNMPNSEQLSPSRIEKFMQNLKSKKTISIANSSGPKSI